MPATCAHPHPPALHLPPQYFNELAGEEARRLFKEFVGDWNDGHVSGGGGRRPPPREGLGPRAARAVRLAPEDAPAASELGRCAFCPPCDRVFPLPYRPPPPSFPLQLASKYYQGLVMAPTKRTTHQWGFSAPKGGRGGGVAALAADQQQQRQEAREGDARERRKWRSEQKVGRGGERGGSRHGGLAPKGARLLMVPTQNLCAIKSPTASPGVASHCTPLWPPRSCWMRCCQRQQVGLGLGCRAEAGA